MSGGLRGYRRADGRLGARNHILVLPSVVCADQTATLIGAETGAISVVHQHGCGQVGDDVAHTERAFLGFATNPNIGATVVQGAVNNLEVHTTIAASAVKVVRK